MTEEPAREYKNRESENYDLSEKQDLSRSERSKMRVTAQPGRVESEEQGQSKYRYDLLDPGKARLAS
jgi:hypothetical protein